MNDMYFRAVMDDGSTIEWEQEITLPDGTVKPASIDDLDRSQLSNLLTVLPDGTVAHALGFSPVDRATKLAVWRLHRKWNPDTGIETLGALSGYNLLQKDGSEQLYLDFIAPDGTVSSGSGMDCQLHPGEVFSKDLKATIQETQDMYAKATLEDNALLEAIVSPVIDSAQTIDEYLAIQS